MYKIEAYRTEEEWCPIKEKSFEFLGKAFEEIREVIEDTSVLLSSRTYGAGLINDKYSVFLSKEQEENVIYQVKIYCCPEDPTLVDEEYFKSLGDAFQFIEIRLGDGKVSVTISLKDEGLLYNDSLLIYIKEVKVRCYTKTEIG